MMAEIKNQILKQPDGSFIIEERHTIADIARWVIEQDWVDELLWCLKEEMGHEHRDEQIKGLVEALEWYQDQTRLARLIHSEGDEGRNALAKDGGDRAQAALAIYKEQTK